GPLALHAQFGAGEREQPEATGN
ncbi:MAG: hypothetical protein JWQ17_6878, partial [Tardiphaga sp.]|nr:hypothetical protein [Tardiphaga sp.]